MRPISVLLVTGYLGAGKTTLVNRLLVMPSVAERETALIINDFGQTGVDGALVKADGRPKYEINRGSVFCACTQVELLRVLSELAQDGRTEQVLVEATGVAETTDFEKHFDQRVLAERYAMRANLCLVDAVNFIPIAASLKAAASQVAAADGVVINKTDLAPEESVARLRALIAEINPKAPCIAVENAQIPEDFLQNLRHVRYEQPLSGCAPLALATASFDTRDVVDRRRFEEALNELGDNLLRLKGNIRFDDGLVFYEVVHSQRQEKPAEPDLGTGTRFTAIARDLSREHLRHVFMRSFLG